MSETLKIQIIVFPQKIRVDTRNCILVDTSCSLAPRPRWLQFGPRKIQIVVSLPIFERLGDGNFGMFGIGMLDRHGPTQHDIQLFDKKNNQM